jgi:hypothetical protein
MQWGFLLEIQGREAAFTVSEARSPNGAWVESPSEEALTLWFVAKEGEI